MAQAVKIAESKNRPKGGRAKLIEHDGVRYQTGYLVKYLHPALRFITSSADLPNLSPAEILQRLAPIKPNSAFQKILWCCQG